MTSKNADIYETAAYRASTNDSTRIDHDENYRGHQLRILTTDWPRSHGAGTLYTRVSVWIDGRTFRTPSGTVDRLVRVLRHYVDRDIEDAALLPRLLAMHDVQESRPVAAGGRVEPGAPAYVLAYRYWRRGLITAVGKTRVTIAFTTPASLGRVFRKSVPLDQISL